MPNNPLSWSILSFWLYHFSVLLQWTPRATHAERKSLPATLVATFKGTTPTAKTFPCNLCDNNFFTKTRLNQHMMAKHNDNPHLIPNKNLCIECRKTFVSPERLQEHKANMHTVDKLTLTCRVCKKNFQNSKVYKRHSHKYHLELPCTAYENKFDSKSALRAHS